ncbi:hypothetical protein [Streptomyces sp. NPDC096311]|uniref:hypothetical protein n=1 Tax=Streptomyces sp. NPDC096311 TaxID=3366083 RepID=UPI0038236560
MNRIEAQFTALRVFTLDSTDHAGHEEQGSVTGRSIMGGSHRADHQRLRVVAANDGCQVCTRSE